MVCYISIIEIYGGLQRPLCDVSRRIGSALVWHTRGRVFEPQLMQKVLRFVGRVFTVQYVELGGSTAHEGGGCY